MLESELRLGSISYKNKYIFELNEKNWNEGDFLTVAFLCGCDVSFGELNKFDLKKVKRYLREM